MASDVERRKNVLLAELRKIGDPSFAKKPLALAAVAMILESWDDEEFPEEEVAKSLPDILGCIGSDNLDTKINASAVYIALVGLEGTENMITDEAVLELVSRLMPEWEAQPVLKVNACVMLEALARRGESCAQRVAESQGMRTVLDRWMHAEGGDKVLVAALDVVCCCMSVHAASNVTLQQAGAIRKLAPLLQLEDKEVRVRVLMALGMLLVDGPTLVEFAKIDGAAQQILALMKQKEDEDCRHIAESLFAGLTGHAEAQELVSSALRQQEGSQMFTD